LKRKENLFHLWKEWHHNLEEFLAFLEFKDQISGVPSNPMQLVSDGDGLEAVFLSFQEHHHSCFSKLQALHHPRGSFKTHLRYLGINVVLNVLEINFFTITIPSVREWHRRGRCRIIRIMLMRWL
jgi:hypothetical protein